MKDNPSHYSRALANRLVLYAWLTSGALEVWKLRFRSGDVVSIVIGVNPGGLGVATPQSFGRGSWGSQGGSQGGSWGCGRVVKYYYILSCTDSMFESGDF